MTERTFRSPSPGAPHQRSLSSGGKPRSPYQSDDPPPPVPAIPASVNMEAAKKQGARPKSLGIVATPVRTASQKAKDAPGPWFGAAKQGDMSNVRTSDAIMSTSPTRTTHAQEPPERPESGESSVNFSYPARVRLASPAPSVATSFARPAEPSFAPAPRPQVKQKKRSSTMSPQRGGSSRPMRSSSVAPDQTLVYDPNSRRMITRAELLAVERHVQAAFEARSTKKKQTPTRVGSHLAKGTVGRSHGTAVDSGISSDAQMAAAASLRSHRGEERQPIYEEPEEQYQQPTLNAVSRPLAPESSRGRESWPVRHADISTSPASDAPEVLSAPRSPTMNPNESSLQRKPSVVKEETEESVYEAEPGAPAPVATQPNVSHALDSVPVRQNMYDLDVPSQASSDLTDDQPVDGRNTPAKLAAASTQPPSDTARSSAYGGKLPIGEPQTQTLRRDSRTNSVSPARTARFTSVHDNLTVRHEPPSRSTSPRKSALKQQSPSRGASPTGISETSEATVQDSVTPTRKKSVRVSFDDGNTVVVGEAVGRVESNSPVPPNPQVTGRRPWYGNLPLGKKKDAPPLEDDEVMKPRPVLPTFGSIRGRKSSPPATEERPLVRPLEPLHDTSEPPSPGLETTASDAIGQSSDHAVGGILHEQGSKNEANISKFREPLPPVVTSLEGNGYTSDTGSSDGESALIDDTPKFQSEESRGSEASTLVAEQSRLPNGSADAQEDSERLAVDVKDFAADHLAAVQAGEVPMIAITQPSPLPSERKSEQSSYIHFPGEFPDTETETETDIEDAKVQNKVLSTSDESAPTRRVTFEPVLQKEDTKVTTQTPSTVVATLPAAAENTDETDGGSVYSDAYEELAEVEGDGFQSLDAVLGSPLVMTSPGTVYERAQAQRSESVTPTPTPHAGHGAVALAMEQHTGKPVGDWEAAKAYWRSLTADKKAQLEVDAAEEAGADGDLEEYEQEIKPRRKKSIEKRNAEKKAIEEQRAAADSERTYMIIPGSKAAEYHPPMKETLRERSVHGKDEAGMHLRKTMRGSESRPVETGAGMRKSLRSEGPGQAKLRRRPTSYQPSLGATSEVAVSNRHLRSMSEGQRMPQGQRMASAGRSGMRRRGSDSSTSSFKRARATSQGVGFRKTMRAGSNSMGESRDQQQQSSRPFSVRSMSPPVSVSGRMRTTLRGDAGSQRRGSQDSGVGYLRFPGGFGHHKGAGGGGGARGKKASRFGDDSSGDDDVPRHFASRFVDSSDEEEAAPRQRQRRPQPPPLSIARTMRGGKGTKGEPSPPLPEEEELSDEDETGGGDEGSRPVVFGLPKSQTEPVIHDGGGRAPRRGFMSAVLHRRNKKRGSGGGDTDVERHDTTTEELGTVRSNDSRVGGSSPRLQKKAASNWPLSGGEAGAGSDEEQAGGYVGDEAGDTDGAGKKKKRFGALRRMFKLDG